eukprot:TRINITY_DN19885_c0_g1_i2.p1 TRINITY_DN19885_c0_g1~~TRINITY_DN19885_c0_g1_i2.p1  ORF type:complete len:567 (+),score=79.93 TRINITY_DN19885_c0_g1_i2:104-1702(+)
MERQASVIHLPMVSLERAKTADGACKTRSKSVNSLGGTLPLTIGGSPTKAPKKKALVTHNAMGKGAVHILQVHLSQLYFKSFFSWGVDILIKNGAYISPYCCIVSKMTPDFLTFSDLSGVQNILYFTAQALPPVFFKKLPSIKQCQIVSHFPRTELICDKVSLGVLLRALKKKDEGEWDFAPVTATTYEEFLEEEEKCGEKTLWVVKDDRGLGGNGIRITYTVAMQDFAGPRKLVQAYVHPPLLINTRRFDIRVYVLVTSFTPFRVYMAKEGVVHLCVDSYHTPTDESNLGPMSSHITNHNINSKAKGYQNGGKGGVSGHSRSFENLATQYPGDMKELMRKIKVIILKTLACVKPFVDQGLRQGCEGVPGKMRCYEMFGYDIIVGDLPELKPYLLEVNQFPSWNPNGPWQGHVKARLLKDIASLCKTLHMYPDPLADDCEAKETVLNNVETAALKANEAPIFERIWPVPAKSPWATPDDATSIHRALALSRSLFTSCAVNLSPDETASVDASVQLTPETDPDGPQVLSIDPE